MEAGAGAGGGDVITARMFEDAAAAVMAQVAATAATVAQEVRH